MTDKKQEVTWDLTELFSSVSDPLVEKAINAAKVFADDFEKKYREKIASLDSASLLRCIQELEAFDVELGDVSLFAGLSFSANMTLPDVQAIYDKVSKFEALLSKQLAFFSLELGALVKAKPEIIVEPVLSGYRHMLERVQRRVTHQLTEVEEQLIIEKTSSACKLGRSCRANGSTPAPSTSQSLARRRRLATEKPTAYCHTPTEQLGSRRTARFMVCLAETAKSSRQPYAVSATTGSQFPNAEKTLRPWRQAS